MLRMWLGRMLAGTRQKPDGCHAQKRIGLCNLAGSFGFIAFVFDTMMARFARTDRFAWRWNPRFAGAGIGGLRKGGRSALPSVSSLTKRDA